MNEKTKHVVAKLRFIEWLSLQDLSALQFRVAIMLVSLYSFAKGYAWPKLGRIVATTGASKKGVLKALEALEKKELFGITRSRGRGHANEYVPRFDRVPEGDVYDFKKANSSTPFSASPTASEKVNSHAEKVNSGALKGEPQYTPSGLDTSDLDSIRSSAEAPFPGDEVLEEETQTAAPNSGGQAVFNEWKARKREFGEHLARVERRLKEEDLPGADLRGINETLDHILGELDRGDPLHQRARRLQNDVEFKLAFER